MKLRFLDKIKSLFAKLPKINLSELIDPRWFKLILFGMLIVTFIIVFFIVFTKVNRNIKDQREAETQKNFQMQLESDLDLPTWEDFIFPEDFHEMELSISPFREKRDFWTQQEVEDAWIEPQAEDIYIIHKKNEELIWSKLEFAP